MPGRIPTIISPSGATVSVLDDNIITDFAEWPSATQRKAVRFVEGLLEELYADGSVPHLCALHGIDPTGSAGLGAAEASKLRNGMIDKCSWRLAQFLRYSRPTRIADAVAPLTFLAYAYKRLNNGAVDVIPTLYLAVALSKVSGEEERAVRTFTEGLDAMTTSNQQTPAKNLIWARANFARLLRQMDRLPEAMQQERMARDWIISNIYLYAPSVFKKAIEDDMGTGEHITDHGDVLEWFSQIREIGPQTAIFKNIMVCYGNK